MPRAGYTAVTVSRELHERLQKVRKQCGLYHLTDTLIEVLDFYELLHEYLASLVENYELYKLAEGTL